MFYICESGTMIDWVLLTAMASRDFWSGYTAVSDHENNDDKILFTTSRN